jgi:hypothetical protein
MEVEGALDLLSSVAVSCMRNVLVMEKARDITGSVLWIFQLPSPNV